MLEDKYHKVFYDAINQISEDNGIHWPDYEKALIYESIGGE